MRYPQKHRAYLGNNEKKGQSLAAVMVADVQPVRSVGWNNSVIQSDISDLTEVPGTNIVVELGTSTSIVAK